MSHSFSQTLEVDCPQCKQHFNAQVWLVVDVAERPDLLERIKDETIHVIPCPHCGYQGGVDAPLLLYRPDEEPHLILSPAQGTSPEQDKEQANELLGWLHQALGDEWRDEWLKRLPILVRPLLATALKEGMEVVAQTMKEQWEQELERLRQEDPQAYQKIQEEVRQQRDEPPSLGLMLQEYIAAPTWGDARHYLETHPELLSDEAATALDTMLQNARAQGDEKTAHLFSEHTTLLQRSREIGVGAAYSEKLAQWGQGLP